MESIKENLYFFIPMMEGIANQFGEHCEVVLHDHSQGLESSIIAIINGHVTGRKVGDPSSNLGLEVLRGTDVNGDRHNYFTQTREGKTLRSTSIYIRDNNQQVIGALCINLDISDILQAEKTLNKMAGRPDTTPARQVEVNEVFVKDVNELLDYLIAECMSLINVAVINMTRQDKLNAIKFFDEKGVFLIKKSGEKICEFLNISKYTLYAYLGEIRGENPVIDE
ncbi:helix-turn-helix transcriptional regulator [Trabulsiella odontotermitis]|uniref:helix-turn-helix transcriptional regulator n=1 Tax=Trabulsiella odontotermitis TaxID=379893 RepID=UPI0024B868AD|nr:helix-turn-helix transcriptional regulator [Trabulsiella odontotermitis]WHP33050.1 helix-turn-helix transcriptional regulator [Trabulsiella odontotermitis]